MNLARKKICDPTLRVAQMVEEIIGCKWAVSVLTCLRKGIVRPGAIEREIEGLSTKMLNQRLRRFLSFGIAVKTVFPESPYHVEYTLTEFGQRFVGLIDMVDELQQYVDLQNRVSSPTALR